MADKFQFGDTDTQSDLANLAKHHIQTNVCAGGFQVFPNGPCDHCGSINPLQQCLRIQGQAIGEPLNTTTSS